jgi:hypothetical protein
MSVAADVSRLTLNAEIELTSALIPAFSPTGTIQLKWCGKRDEACRRAGARHLCRFNVDIYLVFVSGWSDGSRSGVNAALRTRFNVSSTESFRPRRRRIVRHLFEKPATDLAGQSAAKPEPDCGYSFSPGEKVRMRADE